MKANTGTRLAGLPSRPFAGVPALLLQAAVALALAGCGGGDTSGVAPSAAAPTWPDNGEIARVAPGGILQGNLVCAGGSFGYQTFPNGTHRLTSISALSVPKIDNRLAIGYRGTDGFELDVNGFGGDTFGPADEREAVSRGYRYFVQGSSEFEIGIPALGDSALGRYSDGSSLCFFAVGSDRRPLVSGSGFDFGGFADGVAQVGDSARRLDRTSRARGTVDFDRGQIELTLTLSATEWLPSKSTSPMAIGTVTGRLNITPGGAVQGVLNSTDGWNGSVAGQLFEYGMGVGLVFELSHPNGDRIYGAMAADLRQI